MADFRAVMAQQSIHAVYPCPLSGPSNFTAASGQIFKASCNTDFTGTDQGWTMGGGLFDCIEQCAKKRKCSAVTYAWNGACYFKGGNAKGIKSAGSQGAILLASPHVTVTPTVSPSAAPSSSMKKVVSASTTAVAANPTSSPGSLSKSLTILAMGDSITAGQNNEGDEWNSYRLALDNMLTSTTPLWNVNQSSKASAMFQQVHGIGGVQFGNFSENASEGHSGANITELRTQWLKWRPSYTRTPDVATILVGIWDIGWHPYAPAPAQSTKRLGSMVDALFATYPGITVIVSTLTPTTADGWKPGVSEYNAALKGMIQQRASAGKKALLVDSWSLFNASTDLGDIVHPNSHGYLKLATSFYGGITRAVAKGWL